MLADWYFCACLRLPPREVAAYLDVLGILDSPLTDRRQVHTALAELGRTDSTLQLYALPGVLGALRRRRHDQALADDVDRVVQSITALLDGRLGRELTSLLVDTTSGMATGDLAERLITLLESVPARPTAPPQPALTPYTDLADHAAEAVALTLLSEFARTDAAIVAPHCGSDSGLALLNDALAQSYGRFTLLLASAAVSRAVRDPAQLDRLWRSLWQAGAADIEPDLLAATARVFYGHPDTVAPPTLGTLEREALTFTDLRLWRDGVPPRPEATQAALSRFGEPWALDADLTNTVWPAVLWELAAETDPMEAATRLGRWWSVPPGLRTEQPLDLPGALGEDTGSHLQYLVRLRWTEQGHASNKSRRPKAELAPELHIVSGSGDVVDPATGAALYSPWLARQGNDFYPAGNLPWSELRRRSAFHGAEHPGLLLRLLSAATVAIRLLRSGRALDGGSNDYLLGLVVHAADVFMDARFQRLLEQLEFTREEPQQSLIRRPILGLVLQVSRAVMRAGTGVHPELPPAVFASFLLDHAGQPGAQGNEKPAQWQRLFSRAAFGIASKWIEEALAGYVDDRSNGWFEGQPSWAERVLVAASTSLPDRAGARHRQLLAQLFPSRGRSADDDWMARIDQDERAFHQAPDDDLAPGDTTDRNQPPRSISYSEILAAPGYSVQEWVEHDPLAEDLLSKSGAPMALSAVRLAALLGEPGPVTGWPYEDWLDDWLERLSRANGPSRFARPLRELAIAMIAAPPGNDQRTLRRLERVTAATVDAVVELSPDAPRYYGLLLRELARPQSLPLETANELRLRAMAAILRRRPIPDVATELRNPWRVLLSAQSADQVHHELARFAAEVSPVRFAYPDTSSLGAAFGDEWRTANLTAGPAARDRRLSRAMQPDGLYGRLLIADLVDRFRGHRREFLLQQATRARAGVRLLDLFANQRQDRDLVRKSQTRTLVLGVVCAVSTDGDQHLVWFNVGDEMPVEARYQAGETPPQLGDLRAVPVRHRSGKLATVGRPQPTAAPPPAAGEVRAATVRPDAAFPGFSVTIPGAAAHETELTGDDPDSAEARRQWDPDLTRVLRGDPIPETRTVVRWDGQLRRWVPVAGSAVQLLADLAAADLGGGRRRLTFAGSAPGADGRRRWRFVTTPGRAYLLSPDDWAATDAQALAAELAHEPVGLIVDLQPAGGDQPRLRLAADDPFDGTAVDRGNIRWADLFADDDSYLPAEGVQGEWVVPVLMERVGPVGASLPAAVKADGLGPVTDGAVRMCVVSRWGEIDARTGRLNVEPLEERGFRDVENEDGLLDRFLAATGLQDGQTVTIDRLVATHPATLLVSVAGGVIATMPRETAAPTWEDAAKADPGSVRGRTGLLYVRVDRAPQRQPAVPVSLALAELPTVLGSTVEGVVVKRLAAPGAREAAVYGIWLDCGKIRYAHVPSAAFDVLPSRDGDLVRACLVVDGADPARTGWIFTAARRWVTVRGLFAHRTAEKPPGGGWTHVGQLDDGTDLWQRGAELRGVPRPAGKDTATWRGAAMSAASKAPRPGPQDMTVLARQGPRWRAGKAYSFDPSVPSVVLDVKLRLREVERRAADSLVDLRQDLAATRPDQEAEQTRRKPDARRRWEDFLAAGDLHAVGTRQDAAVRLGGGLAVPVAGGVLSPLVPLADGEDAHVAGWSYSDQDVRVALVERHGAWQASFRRARPYTIAEFFEAMGGDHRRRFPKTVNYVAPDPGEHGRFHRLEWGYGYSALLAESELTIAGAPFREDLIFHGDRILGGRFSRADGSLVLNVSPGDIEPRLANRIYRERSGSVVHQLDVVVFPRRNEVRVERILTRRERPDASSGMIQHAGTMPIVASLGQDSVDQIVALTRSLPGADADAVPQRILARLNKEVFERRRGKILEFQYVSASVGGVEGLAAGEYVYLMPGPIITRATDAYLEFRLPDQVKTLPDQPRPVVRVREFSSREFLLRRLVDEGEGALFQDKVLMLVKIRKTRNPQIWNGVTASPPAHDLRTLRTFLAAHPGDSCLAVVIGRKSAGRPPRDPAAGHQDNRPETYQVEIRPGVVYELDGDPIPPKTRRRLHPGAVVRLLGQADTVTVALAQANDRAYLGAHGRRAIVLPKGSLTTGDRRPDPTKPPGGFVAAGLPAVATTPTEELGSPLLAHRHPRIVLVTRGSPWPEARPAGPAHGRGRAGTLTFRDNQAFVSVREPVTTDGVDLPATEIPIPWARLSFADGSRAQLRRVCEESRWTYHDAITRSWPAGASHASPPQQLRVLTVTVEPVFFDEWKGQPSLRYRTDHMVDFGLPSTSVVEAAWTDNTPPQIHATVAGVALDTAPSGPGLWLELSPGRVVELSGQLIVGGDGHPLSALEWELFSPGDQVTLEVTRTGATEPRQARLLSWQPGLRAGLPRQAAGRLLLTVRASRPGDGALELAAGTGRPLEYPATPELLADHPAGSPVWLDTNNDIRSLAFSHPDEGDTVFLSADDAGVLTVHGLPGYQVVLDPPGRGGWPDADWLFHALDDPHRGALLAGLDHALPVTVERTDLDALVVSRRRQPSGLPAAGALVRAEMISRLGPTRTVVVRSGAALYPLSADALVPGLPTTDIDAVVRHFRGGGMLWYRTDAHGIPTGGLSGQTAGTDEVIHVRVIGVVDGQTGLPQGVLCEEPKTTALRWLPVAEAAWTSGLTSDTLREHLGPGGAELRARVLPTGEISLIRLRELELLYSRLRLGDRIRVIAICPLDQPAGGRPRILVRIHLTDLLVPMVVSDNFVLTLEPIEAEVAEQGPADQPDLVLAAPGVRRTVVDLPRWMTTRPDPSRWPSPPAQFAAYWQWHREGPLDSQPALDGQSTLDPAADTHEAVIRWATAPSPSGDEPARGRAIRRWLADHGDAAFNLSDGDELDLAPALAACVVLAAETETGSGMDPRLGVLLLRQLGRRAARSLHTEALAREWLNRDPARPVRGAWQRLADLKVAGELDHDGLLEVLRFASGMLGRPSDDDDPSRPALRSVARSLQAAVGSLESGAALPLDGPLLDRLASLGRGLVPARRTAVAQQHLLPAQAREMRALLAAAVRYPLRLLPCAAPLSAQEARLAQHALRVLRDSPELPQVGSGEKDEV